MRPQLALFVDLLELANIVFADVPPRLTFGLTLWPIRAADYSLDL